LLCNILNQNPRFWATTTSILPRFVQGVSVEWSNAIEVKADLERDRTRTERRMTDALRGFVAGWHGIHDRPVVFDKSRGWTMNWMILRSLFPDSKIIVTVRDLRAIFASCEKQHRATPLFREGPSDTQMNRFHRFFDPKGLIGAPLVGIRDLLDRKPDGVIFVQYEGFAADPDRHLDRLYSALGEDRFDHDLEKIEDTSTDPDGLYLYKFPHKGDGAVKAPEPDEWRNWVAPEAAAEIGRRFAFFNHAFGYTSG
jgi:hypothetical protein